MSAKETLAALDHADVWRCAPPRPGGIYRSDAADGCDEMVLAQDPANADAIAEARGGNVVATVPLRGQSVADAVGKHAEWFARFKKVIIAVADRDTAAEIGRRLGRQRCWIVEWPEGEDAAALAADERFDEIRAAVERAKAAPIAGVFRADAGTIMAFRDAPPPPSMSLGCDSFDRDCALPADGKLITITGIPNHGKSTLVTHLIAHTAHRHGRKWLIFSPEFGDWRSLAAAIVVWRAGRPLRGWGGQPGISGRELEEHGAWLEKHFAFLACDAVDESPSLDWILERAEAGIARDGTTDVVIDPWNELHHPQSLDAETVYLNRCLQRLRSFCLRHGMNVWIVAHPTKLRAAKPGDPTPCPTSYDISGSAAWANKSDMILCVHRPTGEETELHVLKSRFSRWGKRGHVARLTMDPRCGRFYSASIGPPVDE